MNSALEGTVECCGLRGHPLPCRQRCVTPELALWSDPWISMCHNREKALKESSLPAMSEKWSLSTERACLIYYFAINFMYKAFSVNKIMF